MELGWNKKDLTLSHLAGREWSQLVDQPKPLTERSRSALYYYRLLADAPTPSLDKPQAETYLVAGDESHAGA